MVIGPSYEYWPTNSGQNQSGRQRELLLSIVVVGYPSYLSDPPLAEQNQKAELTIHFVDSDGFSIFSKSFQTQEFHHVLDDNGGKIIGLAAEINRHSA